MVETWKIILIIGCAYNAYNSFHKLRGGLECLVWLGVAIAIYKWEYLYKVL